MIHQTITQTINVLAKGIFIAQLVLLTGAARAQSAGVSLEQGFQSPLGDKLAGPAKKELDAYVAPFGGQYELSASGLMGPVRIVGY